MEIDKQMSGKGDLVSILSEMGGMSKETAVKLLAAMALAATALCVLSQTIPVK